MKIVKKGRLRLSPHANEEPHRSFLECWRQMTERERFESVVDAGIYEPDGSLSAGYDDTAVSYALGYEIGRVDGHAEGYREGAGVAVNDQD